MHTCSVLEELPCNKASTRSSKHNPFAFILLGTLEKPASCEGARIERIDIQNTKKNRHKYPFGKGPGQHIIRCLKNKKCEKERTIKRSRQKSSWRTCAATRRRAGLNHLSQYLRHSLLARDNQASGPGDKPFSSLQSLGCTSQNMRSEKHCTSPSLLRTTHESESVGQPGQSTTSIESPKVKNPDPMLHLVQHHLALLHASS